MFLSAIVMACGKGERFGSNKLMAKLKGKELIRYTLDALPAELFSEILVVTKYKEILDLVTEYPAPFLGVYTDDPEGGQDATIRCGVRNLSSNSDGCMFVAADQPLKQKSSLQKQITLYQQYFQKGEEHFVALSFQRKKGNPVIFPKSSYKELLEITDGQTGSTVLRAHPDALVLSEACCAAEMMDIDSLEDLRKVERILLQKDGF